MSSGLTQFSGAKVSNSIVNLVTLSGGNFSSGMAGKYLDVSYTPPSSQVQGSNQDLPGYVLIDDEYDYKEKPAPVSTASLISSTGASATYLNSLGYKIYATVCFTEKERDDGYQYLQIIAGNSAASYDGADKNGEVYDPVNSIYKVCFELADGSNAEGKAYFPRRSTTSGEFSNSAGKLHQQKYKSGYNGNGAVVLSVTNTYITTRFDAGGDNNDTWGYKDLFVRMALCDTTRPSRLADLVVAPGRYGYGNTFYVSVPFNEIVTVTGTPTLNTDWGDLSYFSGSGSITSIDNLNIVAGYAGGSISGTHYRDCCIYRLGSHGCYNTPENDLFTVTTAASVTAVPATVESATIDGTTYYTAGSTFPLSYSSFVPANWSWISYKFFQAQIHAEIPDNGEW